MATTVNATKQVAELLERYKALQNQRAVLVEALNEFIHHYSGVKRAQLGNGFAYQWYDKAEAALAMAEEPHADRF